MMPDTISSPRSSTEELRDEIERLRLMHSISLEFSATLDFDELLPRVFQRALTALGAEGGSLWIAEDDMLCCRIAAGGAGQKLVGAQVPIGTGFVGDVAQRPRTTIVTRAAEDPRYQPRVDSGEVLATTVMATAMVAGGVTVGSIQVSNKLTGDGVFDLRDRELLEGLAASAAAALRNAQLHAVEKRARDLALLLEISREITATLDLDRVLRSVVNLAAKAFAFDRGAVGLYQKGNCEIRAMAGQEKIDQRDPKLQDLATRGAWAAGHGQTLYLSDRATPSSDAERMFVSIFGGDLEADGVQSAL
jgi:GAF domain-containing protein